MNILLATMISLVLADLGAGAPERNAGAAPTSRR
jgi:hypothetical protein